MNRDNSKGLGVINVTHMNSVVETVGQIGKNAGSFSHNYAPSPCPGRVGRPACAAGLVRLRLGRCPRRLPLGLVPRARWAGQSLAPGPSAVRWVGCAARACCRRAHGPSWASVSPSGPFSFS